MKFGIDRTDITPGYRTFMAGYGARNDLSDGVHDPLTFTSLILEEKGGRIFFGAADLVGLGREHSREIREKIAGMLGISLSDVMINCSHTHGGMRVDTSGYLDNRKFLPHIEKNRKLLEKQVFSSVRKAEKKMRRGKVFFGEGKTSVPMNRRLSYKGKVANKPNPSGKTDDSLKVIKIADTDDKTAAVIARVSCHPVATGMRHLITADYPGAFRTVFEKYFPGATAVFWQGAGADARPARAAGAGEWIMMEHDDLPVIGESLFSEVLEVLADGMEPLENLRFRTGIKDAVLPLAQPDVAREDLESMLEKEKDDTYRLCVQKMLARDEIPRGVPMEVQMISFNRRLSLLGIPGEVLCGLAGKLESAISTEFKMVSGYTNGSGNYLPDKRELKRGGYEVESYILSLLPSALSPELEDVLKDSASSLDRKLNRR